MCQAAIPPAGLCLRALEMSSGAGRQVQLPQRRCAGAGCPSQAALFWPFLERGRLPRPGTGCAVMGSSRPQLAEVAERAGSAPCHGQRARQALCPCRRDLHAAWLLCCLDAQLQSLQQQQNQPPPLARHEAQGGLPWMLQEPTARSPRPCPPLLRHLWNTNAGLLLLTQ